MPNRGSDEWKMSLALWAQAHESPERVWMNLARDPRHRGQVQFAFGGYAVGYARSHEHTRGYNEQLELRVRALEAQLEELCVHACHPDHELAVDTLFARCNEEVRGRFPGAQLSRRVAGPGEWEFVLKAEYSDELSTQYTNFLQEWWSDESSSLVEYVSLFLDV